MRLPSRNIGGIDGKREKCTGPLPVVRGNQPAGGLHRLHRTRLSETGATRSPRPHRKPTSRSLTSIGAVLSESLVERRLFSEDRHNRGPFLRTLRIRTVTGRAPLAAGRTCRRSARIRLPHGGVARAASDL